MTEIPTEALEAAARVSDEHEITVGGGGLRWNGAYCKCGWESGIGEMTQIQAAEEGWRHVFESVIAAAAPYLIAEGRRQGIAQVFAPKARELTVALDEDGPVDDETPAVMARYERQLRAKIAAEIRARAQEFRGVDEAGDAVARWAAVIAEGTDHG